jgi:hypothetical protein
VFYFSLKVQKKNPNMMNQNGLENGTTKIYKIREQAIKANTYSRI